MSTSTNSLWVLLAISTLGCGGSSAQERQAELREQQADLAKEQAAKAVVVGKTEPGSACRLIGAAQGADPKMYAPFANLAANSEGALENLREKAVEQGANYLLLDFMAGPMANGRLYACPAGGIPDPARPGGTAASASACKPDCSPGFACVDGACVSACNPACKAGQQCGADRTCR